MESGNLRELADPKMKGSFDMEQLYRVALTASYCVRQSSIWRPSMTEVNFHRHRHKIHLFYQVLFLKELVN